MAKDYSLEYSPDKSYVFGFKIKKVLYSGKTRYQKMELYDTPMFGKLLKLDDAFQTSEGDEFFYHEPLIHVPLMTLPNPKRVLIIGGGDGGALREVLRHPSVQKATLAEIDKGVIDFSKKYLKNICRGALEDKRADVFIGDGKKYVEESREKFDLIIIDLTDPVGPARPLYEPPFYKSVANHLTKNGLLCLQSESPVTRKEIFKMVVGNLQKSFKYVRPFVHYVPLYGTLWSFTVAGNGFDPAKVNAAVLDKRVKDRGLKGKFKWYRPEIHQSLFNLPPFVEKLIK
ncbi:MAG: polyamine aminopropyltransferase [bacterium]|nr:polyamine aminopropyltransferase [bacterium]